MYKSRADFQGTHYSFSKSGEQASKKQDVVKYQEESSLCQKRKQEENRTQE